MIERDIEQGQSSTKSLEPVVEMILDCTTCHVVVLPNRVIRILDGQRLQPDLALGLQRLIDLPKVLLKDLCGPCVGQNVMNGNDEFPIFLGDRAEACANERLQGEIERDLG